MLGDTAVKGREKLENEKKAIDEQILALAAQRLAVAKSIGAVKRDNNRAIKDADEEAAVFRAVDERCAALGLDPAFGRRLVQMLVDEALRTQGFTDE